MATIQLKKQNKTIKVVNRQDTIRLQHTGHVGPTGPQGPQGPPGPVTGDKNYTQNFTSSTLVTVAHNLSKTPSVQIIDSAGDQVEGMIHHINSNQLTISFSAAFSGVVTCN